MQILYYEKQGSDFAPMNGICPSLTPKPENLWQAQNHRPSADPVGTLAQRESHWLTNGTKQDRKSTRLNSSHALISYAVFCLKKKKNI